MRGILELNALFLAAGLALLWGLRGWRSWLELLDTLGVALILGLSAVGVLATLVLIAGGGLPTVTILGLCAGVVAVGTALALAKHRPFPRALGRLRLPPPGVFVAAGIGLITVTILVALFRVARVAPMGGGDSFEFWVPKAKIIYFFGTIDDSFFKSLPEQACPVLVPALQAMDFRFMGNAEGPALAVQYWILYAGFVFASASLLRRLVPAWLAWLFAGSTAVIPELDDRILHIQADWILDIFFALTALFVVNWLQTREVWLLACFGVMFAATVATKREGQLFAAALVAGVIVATARTWRRSWPPVLGVSAIAYLTNVPWLIWWTSRHLVSDIPGGGGAEQLKSHISRLWPSLDLVLRLLFDDGRWLTFVPVAVVAAAASLTLGGRARQMGLLYLVTGVLSVGGLTWFLWAQPNLPLDEHQSSTAIPRAVGALVLVSTVLAPILLEPLLRRRAAAGSNTVGSSV